MKIKVSFSKQEHQNHQHNRVYQPFSVNNHLVNINVKNYLCFSRAVKRWQLSIVFCWTVVHLSFQIQSDMLACIRNKIILKQTHRNTLKSLSVGKIFKKELSDPKLGFPTIVLLVYHLMLQYTVVQQSWTYFNNCIFFCPHFHQIFHYSKL